MINKRNHPQMALIQVGEILSFTQIYIYIYILIIISINMQTVNCKVHIICPYIYIYTFISIYIYMYVYMYTYIREFHHHHPMAFQGLREAPASFLGSGCASPAPRGISAARWNVGCVYRMGPPVMFVGL